MPERIELSETAATRRTIDASWSPRKKMLIGTLFAGVALGTLGVGGFFAWQLRPVGLPSSAEQAISTISSGRVERLDEQRRRQYLAEAGRLLRELPDEQRREMMSNVDNREALMDIRQEFFDDMIRKYARGEGFDMPWGRGGGRPRGNRPQGGEREELSDEERDARRRERAEQMRNRLTEAFESGNAQSTALRGEFFKRIRQEGGFGGGGRPGGGGGGGGGR